MIDKKLLVRKFHKQIENRERKLRGQSMKTIATWIEKPSKKTKK